uniref:Uncharacterized protein n=1 Tax=Anguilla anguilla TaxID=7936 RepID=A0A0E9TV72_ANGAN
MLWRSTARPEGHGTGSMVAV